VGIKLKNVNREQIAKNERGNENIKDKTNSLKNTQYKFYTAEHSKRNKTNNMINYIKLFIILYYECC
jgi:hypothetical protein